MWTCVKNRNIIYIEDLIKKIAPKANVSSHAFYEMFLFDDAGNHAYYELDRDYFDETEFDNNEFIRIQQAILKAMDECKLPQEFIILIYW